MIITDPTVQKLLKPDVFDVYGTMVFFTIVVLIIGRIWAFAKRRRAVAIAE